MQKKLILGFITGILLISLLPFPQNIERTYHGINTTNDEAVDITLDMKYLRFLFLDHKLYGSITVKTETETFTYGEHLHYLGQFPNKDGDYSHRLSGWYYNETMYMKEYENGSVSKMPVGFESLDIHISSSFDNILISHHKSGEIATQTDCEYIGSVDKNQLSIKSQQ